MKSTKINEFLVSLIQEGEEVLKTKWQPGGKWALGPPTYVDLQVFTKWRASCQLLVPMMGYIADPWKDTLASDRPNKIENAMATLGTLKAISEAINKELLFRIEDLIFAEAFADLMDQAEYLLDQGYTLASGVILRAILEERLKRLCATNHCEPEKERPTISDYNQKLYKEHVYDKTMFKHVDSMTGIGNDAYP